MTRRLNKPLWFGKQGTVTAELAMAMPSVVLVIAICLSGFGLQIERMKFVGIAATAARALGRGEDSVEVAQLVAESAPEAKLRVEYLENHICANLSRSVAIAGIQEFEISERQCSRKMSL